MEFPGYIEYEEYSKIADDFLQKHHPDVSIPIPIEEIAEFKLNIHLVPVDGLMERHGMDAYITRDLSEIAIDRRVFEYGGTRFKFSIAHEIAHILLGHHKYFAHIQSTDEWLKSINELPGDIYGRLEYQANCVASCILVPNDGLKEKFEEKKSQFMSGSVSDLEAQDIAEKLLAHDYAVNDRTMHVRLEKERLLKYPWDK